MKIFIWKFFNTFVWLKKISLQNIICYNTSEEKTLVRQSTSEELDKLEKHMIKLTHETKDKIKSMVEDVERKVRFLYAVKCKK